MTEQDGTRRQLSELDQRILQFMKKDFKYKGARDLAIKQEFDLNAIEFFHRVNTLIDTEAALAYDPILIGQLRKARENPFS